MWQNNNIILTLVFILFLKLNPLNLKNILADCFAFSFLYENDDYQLDLDDDVLALIQRYIGHYETYKICSEDGYILSLFRIPRENSKGVIFLDNPLFHDATFWVAQHDKSAAFLLWQAGYDIWLGNSRGTFYSKEHVLYSSEAREFWNHSFHEMGYYDSSAAINFINLKTNGTKIIYFGYSLGANKALAYASTRPESNELLKMIIAMTPATSFSNGSSVVISGFRYICRPLIYVHKHYGIPDLSTLVIMHQDVWYLKLARRVFRIKFFKGFVRYFMAAFFGWSQEFDFNLVNMRLKILGSETSFKTLYHFYQLFESSSFQMYDYANEERNMIAYGTKKPPLYPLKKIKIPVLIVYGDKDTLSTPDNSEELFRNLSEEAKVYGTMKVEGFNHLDFAFGRNRIDKFYKKIIETLNLA